MGPYHLTAPTLSVEARDNRSQGQFTLFGTRTRMVLTIGLAGGKSALRILYYRTLRTLLFHPTEDQPYYQISFFPYPRQLLPLVG